MRPTFTAVRDGNELILDVPYNLRGYVRQVRGSRWNAGRKRWTMPATPLSLESAEKVCDLIVSPAHHRKSEGGPRVQQFPNDEPKLWRHQREAVEWLEDELDGQTCSGRMLWYGMGTGKTRIVLEFIERNVRGHVIVACPKSVIPAWAKEVKKVGYLGHQAVPLRGGTMLKRTNLAFEAVSAGPAKIVIVNYDIIWRKPFSEIVEDGTFEMIVADESHALKGRSSKRALWFRRAYKWSRLRLALTGTPISNGQLSDFFQQSAFLDPGLFGTSITDFEARFAIKPANQHFVVGWRNLQQFNESMFRLVRHEDRSVLDLPPEVDIHRAFDLTKTTRRVYEELRDDFVARIEAGVVMAPQAIVLVNKLQQVTGGFVYHDDEITGHKGTENLGVDRENLLKEIMLDLGDEPCVIFYKFKEDRRRIGDLLERMGVEYLSLSGNVNELDKWQAGEATALVIQVQSGSLGIDLTRAAVCIFYSIGYSLDHYVQARARISRPGQERSTTFVHMSARGTIDEKIMSALRRKEDLVEQVLAGKESL